MLADQSPTTSLYDEPPKDELFRALSEQAHQIVKPVESGILQHTFKLPTHILFVHARARNTGHDCYRGGAPLGKQSYRIETIFAHSAWLVPSLD